MSGAPHWIGRPVTEREEREMERITPTADEARNGWTEESLSRYVHEQRMANDRALDPTSRPRPRPTRCKSQGFSFGPARRGGRWAVETKNFGPWAGKSNR